MAYKGYSSHDSCVCVCASVGVCVCVCVRVCVCRNVGGLLGACFLTENILAN